MLTNLTKVIMENDPLLRDAWMSKIPVVSTLDAKFGQDVSRSSLLHPIH